MTIWKACHDDRSNWWIPAAPSTWSDRLLAWSAKTNLIRIIRFSRHSSYLCFFFTYQLVREGWWSTRLQWRPLMDRWDRRLTRQARVLLLGWPCLWQGNHVFLVGFMELFFEAWSDFANQGPCQPGYPGELHCAWTLRYPTLAVITRKGVPSLFLKTVSKFPISRFVPSLPKLCPTQAAWETLTNTHNLWRALYSIGCLHILSQYSLWMWLFVIIRMLNGETIRLDGAIRMQP